MSLQRIYYSAMLIGISMLVVGGCQSPGPKHVADPLTRIARLTEKATAVHVHRFRKPHRDEQARMRRELALECERLVREIQAGGPESQALTGIEPEQQRQQEARIALFESALRQLSDAAERGNSLSIRRSYEKVKSVHASLNNE